MEFYLIRYIYDGLEGICIWYTDDYDGFCINEDKQILSFSTMDAALFYLSQIKVSLYDDSNITTYNFEKLKQWIVGDDLAVDCNEFLNFWNVFTDAAYVTEMEFEGDRKATLTDSVYDKLFYGCNVLKPEKEEDFVPVWNKKEIKHLKFILMIGLNMFVETLHRTHQHA